MLILAIESSCDETAAAVCEERKILSSVINTQIEEHKKFGGVVPEVASRRHCENIAEVVSKALSDAGKTYSDIDAVAVTFAPGLIGALLVGVNFAKGLALSLNVPLIPVHHLRSHIAANYINNEELKPPFLCLTVSGGNTTMAFRPINVKASARKPFHSVISIPLFLRFIMTGFSAFVNSYLILERFML